MKQQKQQQLKTIGKINKKTIHLFIMHIIYKYYI